MLRQFVVPGVLLLQLFLVFPAMAQISVTWKDTLSGDYSFVDRWSYPEGVYINRHGQVSCDGLCPPGTDRMKDFSGKIFEDSLALFYELVDTFHIPHSIQCKAKCYEFAGTNFIEVRRKGKVITATTSTSVGTHSSLQFTLTDKSICNASIKLVSIVPGRNREDKAIKGELFIDRRQWEQGVFKARFRFLFGAKMKNGKAMFWEGRVLAVIRLLVSP